MRSTPWEVVEKPLTAPLWPLSDTDLRTDLAACQELVDRAQARVCSLLTEASTRGICDPSGLTGPRPHQLLSSTAMAAVGMAEAKRIARRAVIRRHLPLLAACHEMGAVSTAFLDVAGRGLDRLPIDARASLDEILAGPARVCDPSQIRALVAQLRVMIDPDGVSERADHLDNASRVSLDPFGSDGGYALSGTLYGLEAERLSNLLATYLADARRHGDTRPADQRRAGALFTLAGLAEQASTAPGHHDAPHGASAQIIMLVTPDAWNNRADSPAAITSNGHTVDLGQVATLRCATTAAGQLPDLLFGTGDETSDLPDLPDLPSDIPSADAQWIRRALTGLADPIGYRFQPLTLGRSARVANPSQWAALIARDKHCVNPGCTAPPGHCQAHHLREYDADTGPTNLRNLALVCDREHLNLHRTGKHLHPPWCTCGCPTNQWTVHPHPPQIERARASCRRRG